MSHPHLRERGTVRRVADASDQRIRHSGPCSKVFRWPADGALTADRLGEHDEDVLRNVLGLTETEIEELYRDKTIVRDPVLDSER